MTTQKSFLSAEQVVNPKYWTQAAALRKDFDGAQPCRHLALPDFLSPELADSLYGNFPSLETLNVKRKSLNENKSEDYHFERWHPDFSKLREVVSSEAFCKWMEEVTGIEGLSTTNDSLGSGVHQGGQGSYVDVHVDVNMNPKAGLWRRINLLIYLNKNWKPEYGGALELWDKEMTKCEVSVPCVHNMAVIFYTDDNSPHGYAKIDVPEGETRKSFYTYFYTPLGEGFKYRDSRFVSRPDEALSKRMATEVKESIKIRAKQFLKALGIRSLDFQDKNKD
jgi:hypothetical protein